VLVGGKQESINVSSGEGRIGVFTDGETLPGLNRAERKRLEAIRLGSISDRAQTIKYADFLNNGEDILVQDPKFAKVYIREVVHDLEVMTPRQSRASATRHHTGFRIQMNDDNHAA
jgi:hypothetical protein